jgi:serine protease AprX
LSPIERRDVEDLIFGVPEARRHTQDSPVSPDVWLAYWEAPDKPADLLLGATIQHTAAELAVALRNRLATQRTAKHPVRLAHTASYVAAQLSFDELLWAALPLSKWWIGELQIDPVGGLTAALRSQSGNRLGDRQSDKGLLWLIDLTGLIAVVAEGKPLRKMPDRTRRARALLKLLKGRDTLTDYADPLLAEVSQNRPASPAIYASRQSVKVDAAERVFAPSCAQLCWAVIDSGIDALHPAFRRRSANGRLLDGNAFEQIPDEHLANKQVSVNRTRIVATYDFRRLRDVQSSALEPGSDADTTAHPDMVEIARTLAAGRLVDWDLLAPQLKVAHDHTYVPPSYPHGTHVAGILAADWRADEPGLERSPHDLRGICPDLELYDLRVLDDDGTGSEFAILAALQFVRDLNARSDRMRIHGVNISLSLEHDFRMRACGHTAVCHEAEALVANGVVVVAAAGNQGMATFDTNEGRRSGFRTVAITDPGNAQEVITVGSTHRSRPHEYGVSYFSSRGPTGDGRLKPDLVAPGEKIEAPFPAGKWGTQDGTSMSAPHVSGAAALILARHRELVSRPRQVKNLLCETATDLGRERAFQGAGLVDALRALQGI